MVSVFEKQFPTFYDAAKHEISGSKTEDAKGIFHFLPVIHFYTCMMDIVAVYRTANFCPITLNIYQK